MTFEEFLAESAKLIDAYRARERASEGATPLDGEDVLTTVAGCGSAFEA